MVPALSFSPFPVLARYLMAPSANNLPEYINALANKVFFLMLFDPINQSRFDVIASFAKFNKRLRSCITDYPKIIKTKTPRIILE